MWEFQNPKRGDQIRVNRGLYYHHGIYEDEDKVYHFASLNELEISEETAQVLCTSLSDFLKGGNVEVRVYTDDESKNKKSIEETLDYAKAHLGEKGYNLLSNNCEHFSNRCAFGESKSEQVESVMNIFSRLFG